MMLQPERAAAVLSRCSQTALSVSQLASEVGGNHQNVIELLRELESRGLLSRLSEKRGRGRPQHLLRTTPIGEQFLQQYDRLLHLRLRSNENDIKKALHQADLARRLEEQRVSPYALFQEVNELARNISGTAQAYRHTR